MMISHEEKKDDDDVIYQEHHHAKAQASSTDDDTSAPREKKNLKHQTKKKKTKSPLLLLLCATGITSCYLWYGTIQEHLFQLDNAKAADEENDGRKKQSITLFLLATGTFSSSLLALIWIMIGPIILSSSSSSQANTGSSSVGRLNHPLLAITSVTYLSAMAASNESLHYVSYPTCVLAKSSKLIPTMVVGWLVDKYRSWKVVGTSNHSSSSSSICNNGSHNNKGINGMEWLGAAFITIGILAFQYIQLQKQSNGDKSNHGEDEEVVTGDSPYGLTLLGMSLFMDGLLGACQSTLKRKHLNNYFRPPSAMETMLFINLYATLILIPCSYYAGQFTHGMSMLFPRSSNNNNLNSVEEVDNTSKLLLQLNLSASLGQVFIFLTIHQFSPLTCTTITTTRKFVTILLSVYKFGHVLDIWQWSSVGLVFGGLYLEIVAKFREEKGSEVNEDERGGEKEKGD
jgi:UDP-galactose transporter B1